MSLLQRAWQWFFRNLGNEPSPIVLGQRRIYILPTKNGLLFASVLILMYTGAVNYNLGLGHALVFLLTGLGVVGMLHTFRNVFGLRILAGSATPVFAGQQAEFQIILENRDERPRPAITLQNAEGTSATIDLAAYSTKTIRLRTIARSRGWQKLGRLTLSCRYPLGIFKAWAYPSPESHCLIYPKPVFAPLPAATASGHTGAHSFGPGDEDFAGFRNHAPGDSIRHAAWKSFARDPEHRPLQLKVYSGGLENELWLSWSDLSHIHDEEERLSILTGWVILAEEAHQPFGVSIPTRQIPVGTGPAHTALCLQALALFGTDEPDNVA